MSDANTPEPTPHEQYWADVQRRYDAINQRWKDADLPVHIRETPEWLGGWQAMHDEWLKTPMEEFYRRPSKDMGYWPNATKGWASEVHIFAHHWCPKDHGAEHVAFEEMGQRAVLNWWQRQRQQQVN